MGALPEYFLCGDAQLECSAQYLFEASGIEEGREFAISLDIEKGPSIKGLENYQKRSCL